MKLPARARIVEVGPRDGLQNEPEVLSTEDKLDFIVGLADAGLRDIEVTSFVHPRRVPQLADAAELVSRLPRRDGVQWSALVPNVKGLERALACGDILPRIAVFTAASETFTQKNIGMSINQSLDVFREVTQAALAAGLSVRGYVSTCFGCPYEGDVDVRVVIDVAQELLAMGVDEVSLGDTIGVAVPTDVERVMARALTRVPTSRMAMHFHDTSGTALANVLTALLGGVTTFDASAGGLGGCPYAPGAAGNLATEDLVYFLRQMGIDTGVDLDRLAATSGALAERLGRPLPSKQLQRLLHRRATCTNS